MRTIIIGGTFNPIHNGHLYISEELRIQLGYERILFVPSNSQVHKPKSELVSNKDRIRMMELALENSNSLIDLCEIERGGISYMIDTVKMVREKYTITGRVSLFVGDDLIMGMQGWHNIEELLEIVDIVVAHRNSEAELETPLVHSYLNNVPLPISSFEIRRRIKTGKAFRYLVPEKVYEYILEEDLYKVNVS